MQALWKGFINFGLISIPVRLLSAIKERELEFHLFHKKDKGKIKYVKICEIDNIEIPLDEIVKGYEYKKGKYVFLEEGDFEKANIHKANSIDIIDFVEENEINTIFYEKPYFLQPDAKNLKPFVLLMEALKETKKVCVAKFILHNHEHLAIVKPYSNTLILNQLRYPNEIKDFQDSAVSFRQKSSKEVNIAIKLIEELSGTFDPKKYKDSYVEDLKKIIMQKSKGKKIVPKGKKPKATKKEDISFLLKKSLQIKKNKRKKIA